MLSHLTANDLKKPGLPPVLKTLTQLSPYKLDSFKFEFQSVTGKSLHDVCMALVAEEDSQLKTLVAGITLGPLEFDLYLLKQAQRKKMDDDLILIFVGRQQDDLEYLDSLWSQRTGCGLTPSIPSLTSKRILQYALRLCLSLPRNNPLKPTHDALIHPHIRKLDDLLQMTFTSTLRGEYSFAFTVLDILLKRSNTDISKLALYFEVATGSKLEKKILNSTLDNTTKRIAVHALRTARDPTYRDCKLLNHAFCRPSAEEDIAIRVCRAHWYSLHWKEIQAAWTGIIGSDIKTKISQLPKGLFRELLLAMTEEGD